MSNIPLIFTPNQIRQIEATRRTDKARNTLTCPHTETKYVLSDNIIRNISQQNQEAIENIYYTRNYADTLKRVQSFMDSGLFYRTPERDSVLIKNKFGNDLNPNINSTKLKCNIQTIDEKYLQSKSSMTEVMSTPHTSYLIENNSVPIIYDVKKFLDRTALYIKKIAPAINSFPTDYLIEVYSSNPAYFDSNKQTGVTHNLYSSEPIVRTTESAFSELPVSPSEFINRCLEMIEADLIKRVEDKTKINLRQLSAISALMDSLLILSKNFNPEFFLRN